jgi:hypothetical protein
MGERRWKGEKHYGQVLWRKGFVREMWVEMW